MNNVHPLMAGILSGFAPEVTTQENEYRNELQAFDWTFEFSDDQEVWRRGKVKLAALHAMQAAIDPSGAIWMEYRPDAYECPYPRVQRGAA